MGFEVTSHLNSSHCFQRAIVTVTALVTRHTPAMSAHYPIFVSLLTFGMAPHSHARVVRSTSNPLMMSARSVRRQPPLRCGNMIIPVLVFISEPLDIVILVASFPTFMHALQGTDIADST